MYFRRLAVSPASRAASAALAPSQFTTTRFAVRSATHATTLAIHADTHAGEGTPFSHDADIAPPIGMSTTFECRTDGQHIYSRMSNPTRSRCETVLAAVYSAGGAATSADTRALLYSSGLAAAHAALHTFAKDGRLRVAIDGGYHGTHMVLNEMRTALGPGMEVVPLPSAAEAAKPGVLKPGQVVWLETPRNPACDIYDVAAYVRAAHAASAHVVVDSTFAPPPTQVPLALGADICMHSSTKYLAGHSDALGGVLFVGDSQLHTRLLNQRTAFGAVPGSMETWLLLRSLRTLHLRVEKQCATAAGVAAWLHEATHSPEHPLHGLVHDVRHPSLPSHPGHEIAKRQMAPGLFGGTFALLLRDEAAARALPAQLRLFKDATSLGGVESLIEWRRKYDDDVDARLLRVSVGLEHQTDLIADLESAIQAVSAS